MSGIIPENSRLDLVDALALADNDCRTAGVLIVMVAPTTEGWSRDVVLAHGKLETGPALMHVCDVASRALQQHNARPPESAR